MVETRDYKKGEAGQTFIRKETATQKSTEGDLKTTVYVELHVTENQSRKLGFLQLTVKWNQSNASNITRGMPVTESDSTTWWTNTEHVPESDNLPSMENVQQTHVIIPHH